MSIITGKILCKACKAELEFWWQYPDCKADRLCGPGQHADYIRAKNRYDVIVKCPHCRNQYSVYYDLDGNRID